MQIHTNDGLIRRRLRVSVVYLVASLAFLIGGFIFSASQPDVAIQYVVSLPALIIGLLLWARNQGYLERWGPRGRQDAILARSLRGLDARHHLFAFPDSSLPDYLIIGPMGVLVLVPRAVTGAVACYDDRWHHDDGRTPVRRVLGWFSPRATLGNPTADAQGGIQATYRYLGARLNEETLGRIRVDGLVVLTHPRVELSLHGCPVPALLVKSLRSHVRRLPKVLSPGQLAEVLDVLHGED
jgi:hypothetical protein